ncbi:MAG: S46 family peptidase [Taibaiella sp.]|nr:S46 family peptidase [Taibaiella sp.]
MKKIFLLFVAVITLQGARADEGMWIPMLIGKNYEEMQRLGLRLTKDDLYNINNSSLKDAILQFAGGCTGEMISDKGLLLTNHHCGYSAIAELSTVDRNLLDNGFWAKSMDEELPAKGITALFLQRMEDVTDEVVEALGKAKGEDYNKKLEAIAKKIEDRSKDGGKLVANVKSYFNGNQFFLLIYKRYTDVRLVGTPPKSLGKFGGDTDNWMWPRHTSDFSMFRVYADENNQPKPYSATNVPFRPKKHLPVSAKGVEEGDYAMIMGYPGRTNRYEVSYGVDLAVNAVNPSIVNCRDLRLAIMKRHMDKDKKVYLQLTSSYSSIANYWKYYIGQTEQLIRLDVVNNKKAAEDKFSEWQRKNNRADGLLGEFAKIYADYTPYAKHQVYYTEAFRAPALTRMAAGLKPLYDAYERHNGKLEEDTLKKYVNIAQSNYRATVKTYDAGTDMELFTEMNSLYYQNVPQNQHPAIYKTMLKGKDGKNKSAYAAYTTTVFSRTFLTDSNKFNAFIKAPTFAKLKADAAVQYANSFISNYNNNYQPKVESFSNAKAELAREYVKQLMEMQKGKKFYPDANSTMRITYGKVMSYQKIDGIEYNYFTTLDGLIAKYKPNDDEFDVPKELIELYKKKDYGRYADADGTLHTCFITNNDITGGNSGSPVMNAYGELTGTAFDGNWEAMSGDIAFDKKYKRTIVCDIRFVLFLIDKMGHADNLIKEMDIRY